MDIYLCGWVLKALSRGHWLRAEIPKTKNTKHTETRLFANTRLNDWPARQSNALCTAAVFLPHSFYSRAFIYH